MKMKLHKIRLLFIAVIIISCNAERKAMKPYNKVLLDPLNEFKDLKKQALADICAKHFPIEVETIIKDSIVEKVVTSTQYDTIRLANNIYLKRVDTIYIDRWKTKEIIKKDTVENYKLKKEISQLNNNLFDLETAYKITKNNEQKLLAENKQLKDNTKNLNYLLGCIWDLTKWWVIIIVALFLGFKLVRSTNIISLIKGFIK